MPKNKPGFFLPLAIFFVFLVILAIAPLWFYIIQYKINKPEPTQPPQVQTSTPSASPAETVYSDEGTTNWKIYQSEEFKYQLKYPNNAELIKPDYNTISKSPSDVIINHGNCINPKANECQNYVDIAIIKDPKQNIQSFVNDVSKELSPDGQCTTRETKIDKISAIELSGCLVGNESFHFFQKENNIFQISVGSDQISHQILSTFQFTE